MSGENKNDQELSAEVIEKYFAENDKHTQDNSSGDKYVDDEDSPEERVFCMDLLSEEVESSCNRYRLLTELELPSSSYSFVIGDSSSSLLNSSGSSSS